MSRKNRMTKKSGRMGNPFDQTSRKAERSAAAVLMHWMRDIIQEKQLDLGLPDVDTIGADRKSPDFIICESRRSDRVLCLIEAKLPYADIFDPKLRDTARRKATTRNAKYFGTTNFKSLAWFSTQKANEQRPEEEQLIDKYSLSEIEDVNQLDQSRFAEPTKRQLEQFLLRLFAIHTGREVAPKHPVDEYLVFRLHEKIITLSWYYSQLIEEKCHKEREFRRQLSEWFVKQGWNFHGTREDFDRVARQTAYLLVNKILFYNVLQIKRPDFLDPLEIPKSLTKGSVLQKTLAAYFERVLEIDYQEIYSTDFIDTLAFPDVQEVVREVSELVSLLKKYDFSKLGYDVLGRVCERLIPPTERHNLGQYFTNADVVDIILAFCHRDEKDKVLDPSCGAGTFLVRAYQHKKIMNQRLEHETILDSLWGVDISRFPAHLSTINLTIRDLGADKNYPNILCEDFFSLQPTVEGFEPEKWRRARALTLGVDERQVSYPRWFDAVVGNPPYTRQEEIPEIAPAHARYKNQLIHSALHDSAGNSLANINRRAGIHAYFFVHGGKFVRDGGRLGFVVSNSWLDVAYGKGLQEFFLLNYKIVAVIESKVERWFCDAQVNTCIVVLEKCKDKVQREENVARFVYLKRPLRELIPPAQDVWEKQVERKNAIEDLKKTIMAHSSFYENDDLRVLPVKQKELWHEGWDKEKQEYVSGRWGKYVRAPSVFFFILEKRKSKLVRLGDIAVVRFGVKTGANEIFYLTADNINRLRLESKYFRPIIFSLKEISGYKLDTGSLSHKVLICHDSKEDLRGSNLLKYIQRAEKRGIHRRPTCAGREPWYSLAEGWKYAPLVFPAKVGERMPVFLNCGVYEDKKLYGILPKNGVDTRLMGALLNSTLTRMFTEFTCRQMTGAQAIADIDVSVVEDLPVLDPACINDRLRLKLLREYDELLKTECQSLFKEIGTSSDEITLEKVKPERRAIDKTIMGDILELSDNDQLEIYRAVVDLVKSRLEKADSVGKLTSEASEIADVREEIVERIKETELS